jgi:hypothetical protein
VARHRPLYESLFEQPDTFLFLARVDGELVGYALGCVAPRSEGWAADTWRVGDRIGELEIAVGLAGDIAATASAPRCSIWWKTSSRSSASMTS